MEVEEIGDKVRRIRPLPHGVTAAAFIGEYSGRRVIVKPSPGAAVQVAMDKLKGVFGVEQMGCREVRYCGKPTVLIEWRENEGRLVERIGVLRNVWALEEIVKILVLDLVCGPGDRTIGNILVLPSKRLLPIDEMRGFLYSPFDRRWRFRYGVKSRVRTFVIARQYHQFVSELFRGMVDRKKVSAALGFKFADKVDDVLSRVEALPSLVDDFFLREFNGDAKNH